MAWSDAARQASIEARRRGKGERVPRKRLAVKNAGGNYEHNNPKTLAQGRLLEMKLAQKKRVLQMRAASADAAKMRQNQERSLYGLKPFNFGKK